MFENDEQVQRVREMGHNDPKRKFTLEEMAKGDVCSPAPVSRRAPCCEA